MQENAKQGRERTEAEGENLKGGNAGTDEMSINSYNKYDSTCAHTTLLCFCVCIRERCVYLYVCLCVFNSINKEEQNSLR